jgi:hypothetical protein
MLLIEHRVNTVAHLKEIPPDRGVEIDIRDYDGELRLVHDPLESGERLADYLDHFRHALVIFNSKCDGLESRIQYLARERGIENYFFLDTALPSLVQLTRRGERRAAVRYSEFEPVELALRFAGLVDWVWVDCFTHLPLDSVHYRLLKRHFKICLVSPELQKHPRARIQAYRRQLASMPVDAVCADHCADWLAEEQELAAV